LKACRSITVIRSIGCWLPQALRGGFPIVSADANLDAYGVTRIW